MPVECNVMISAAGRRVALLQLFERTIEEMGIRGRVMASDITRVSAAFQVADHAQLVPKYADPACLETLLSICRHNELTLIVPTIDPELAYYARHAAAFAGVGTTVGVSQLSVTEIGHDKARGYQWLNEHGFPTPRQWAGGEVLAGRSEFTFPLFAKPRFGSSSIGATAVSSPEDLAFISRGKDYIVQTLAQGVEYTVDVYVDKSGKCRCAVPRRRLETRAGEVSKGMTVRHPAVEALATRVAEALPGAFGVLNIQLFHDEATGGMSVIEINPRFGGGYPLTHEAGAPMAKWLLQEALGLPCEARPDGWRDGLVMLRYDEAVFVDRADVGL